MLRAGPTQRLVAALERSALPLGGRMGDYDPIINAARGRQYVMLGEASHGTHEFYRARAEITERLLHEAGFDAVAVEADWPDAYRVNRFVAQQGSDLGAMQALAGFERFPRWMWRNHEVLRFVDWLHAFNASARRSHPAGFYGLDLYSLNSSVHAVLRYLEQIDPAAAQRARARYGCLWDFMDEPQSYGYATVAGVLDSCEADIVLQLRELLGNAHEYLRRDGYVAEDEYFCAAQNAKVVVGAEGYYRALYRGRPNTWNLRDRHMYDTLEALSGHLGRHLGRPGRIVVWAHNSHIGNAAATEMGERGEINLGQLARAQHGEAALLVGFSTAHGEVTAASDWDMPAERKRVREPWAGSYEELFHQVNHKAFLLDLRRRGEVADLLLAPRLQRAIGVIYRPGTERQSHYYRACLPQQFDFLIHFDQTRGVEALDSVPARPAYGDYDETFPRGL